MIGRCIHYIRWVAIFDVRIAKNNYTQLKIKFNKNDRLTFGLRFEYKKAQELWDAIQLMHFFIIPKFHLWIGLSKSNDKINCPQFFREWIVYKLMEMNYELLFSSCKNDISSFIPDKPVKLLVTLLEHL